MDRSVLRSAPFAIATPIAIVSALAYFGFAPAPPERKPPPSRSADRFASGPAWVEWRTPAFYEARAALDRDDPIETTLAALHALRDLDYERFLAYTDDRSQRLNTPQTMHDRLALHPLFSFWTAYRILSVHSVGENGALLVLVHVEAIEESGVRAVWLVCDDGAWSIAGLRPYALPQPEAEREPGDGPPPNRRRRPDRFPP